MVGFERVQHFLQTSGRGLHLDLLMRLEVVQVLVNRLGRDQLFLDAVQPRQQHRAHRQVRICRRVGTAELDALGFLALRVDRNADAGAAVALRIDQVDGRLIPRHEAAVRIRGGSAEGQQRGRVRQNASDVVNRGFAQVRIPVLLEEEVLAVVPKALVDVHAGAVVLEDGLGHEGDSLAVTARDVLGDVLVLHHVVRHFGQRVEPHVDLGLPRRAYLVVVDLDRHAQALERQHHVRTDVLQAVHGRHGEITLFVARLVAQVLLPVRPFLAAVPEAFFGIQVIVAVVVGLVEADAVQDVELRLRAEVGALGQSGGFQVRLGFLRHVPWIARVHLAGHRVLDVADNAQRRDRGERVLERRCRVRHQQHVALVDVLEAANARPVEPDAFAEGVRAEFPGRDREVLPEAGEVHEFQVNDLDPLVLDEF